jgi:uncharacterized protein (TIGR02453 family)
MLSTAVIEFLRDLSLNNNREWFTANKNRYESARKEFEKLIAATLAEVQTFEDYPTTQVKDCLFRINRDVRFSADKSPYKKYFSAAIGPGGRNSGRIDYYIHIQPDESFLGAGMWAPEPKNLAKFRQEIDFSPESLKGIIEAPEFKAHFPVAWGESLKRPPKGYAEEHPDIALLKRKQLFFMHKYSNEEVVSANFAAEIAKGCRLIKPYCDYLNYLFYDEKDEIISL